MPSIPLPEDPEETRAQKIRQIFGEAKAVTVGPTFPVRTFVLLFAIVLASLFGGGAVWSQAVDCLCAVALAVVWPASKGGSR